MDAGTGQVLYEKNSSMEIPPASLTKLMTMHIVLNEVAAGRASLDERAPVGPESWARNQSPGSSLMFLGPGQIVSLRELLLGLAVSSGNDAAVAAALRFAPTIRDFAGMMNLEARSLGLRRTRFTEPSGISERNITTAGEFALFCREYIRLHPGSLSAFHSVRQFAYPLPANLGTSGGTIVQRNRNTLLDSFPGVDGLKTGYIDESGYNIALTAEREGTRFIAVILGAPSGPGGDRVRDDDGRALLSWGFRNFRTLRPRVEPVTVRVWKGRADWIRLYPSGEQVFTVPADRGGSLRYAIEVEDPLVAPLPGGYAAGKAVFYDDKGELLRISLVTAEACGQGGFLKRIIDGIRLAMRPGS
jgi:D-alanyl-D-alanine carboxypeptidase (penicillin-binding protein 5/6)